MPEGGVPGPRSGDRAGTIVSDLDAATRFFIDVLAPRSSTSSVPSRPRTTGWRLIWEWPPMPGSTAFGFCVRVQASTSGSSSTPLRIR